MTDDRIPGSRRTAVRILLLALGAVQTVDGLYALLAPRSFYDDFPAGRAWVAALPEYSEHLVRDVGSLFLATGALLLAAGWFLGRRLVTIAAAAFLLFSVPHATFHLLNLEPYSTADVVGNLVTLGLTVLVPVAVLLLARRPPPAPGGASAPEVGNAGSRPQLRRR